MSVYDHPENTLLRNVRRYRRRAQRDLDFLQLIFERLPGHRKKLLPRISNLRALVTMLNDLENALLQTALS